MRAATIVVREGEKAWSLREINLVRPPTNQWHRWQVVTVVRGDNLAEWWDDLGPSAEFTAPEMEIPALFEHSVAELRDIATDYRMGQDYWKRRLGELQEESTIVQDWVNQTEENWKTIRNQSVFGPGFHKQRDGFPDAAKETA